MEAEQYKSIIEKSPIGYACHKILCNENGIPYDYEFIEVNAAFEKITGWENMNIVGRKVSELIPGIKHAEFNWIKTYGDIALNGGSKEFEQFSEDLKSWFRINVYSSERGYFITWVTDISKEMQDIEEKSILLTSTQDIIFELDEDYTIKNIIVSDDNFLFMPRQLIMNKKIHELLPKELTTNFISAFQRVNVSGQKEYIKYKSPEGKGDKWFEAALMLRKKGHIKKKYIVSIREITEQKKVEDELEKRTAELENFFYINLDLLCIADLNGNFIKVNKAWEDILGYPVDELEKKKFLDFIHPDDMDGTLDAISKLGQNQQVLFFVNRYKCKDGTYRYIEWCSQPYSQLIYAAARDITGRIQMEEELMISKKRFEIAMKGTRAGLWDWDIKNDVVFYSPQWKSMLGYEEDEIENSFNGWKKLWHPEDKEKIIQSINDYLAGKSNSYEMDYRLRCKNGDWCWVLTRGELMKDSEGEPYRWVGTNIDITYLKEAEGKIRFLSFHDQLTGLYNRSFYEEELKRLDTRRNLPLSIIMADINGLKLANDAFGHLIGDELLKKAAKAINNECRGDEIVCRIGGDEFIILLPKTDCIGAEALVKRITRAASNENVDLIDLSISFGWATKTYPKEDIEEIFRKSEEHMYQRKLSESPKIRGKIINNILTSLYEKFSEEESHSKRVSEICMMIGEKLGLDREELKLMNSAGLFHDIGKITLSEQILYKPEPLNDTEWVEIRKHSETGYRILNSWHETAQLAKYILHHHEHWNGLGYPDGLKGEEIPLQSRIIGIADAYDAMISKRTYRKAFSKEAAIEEIQKKAGTQFDPEITRIFIEMTR